jgi:hypothetical protein
VENGRVPTPEPMQHRKTSGNGADTHSPPPPSGFRQNAGKENSGEIGGEAPVADKPAGGSVGTSEPAKVVARNTINTTHAVSRTF